VRASAGNHRFLRLFGMIDPDRDPTQAVHLTAWHWLALLLALLLGVVCSSFIFGIH
jgi:hypothetical protein